MKSHNDINYRDIRNNRKQLVVTKDDHNTIQLITQSVKKYNIDNITRTNAYLTFYEKNPEIKWALLASMVSRNAGWNMTDLTLDAYRRLFSNDYLKLLFHSYERPNWLIFSDAYPQLLLYELSKQQGKPLFHLLKVFNVSVFMELMWQHFWNTKDIWSLCYSQIVNEQQLIQTPVLEQQFYNNAVFDSLLFHIQEVLHMNAVIFPSPKKKLYGFSVYRFNHVNKRIKLGQQLTWLLFQSPVSNDLLDFALNVEHTGSRLDYEQFFSGYNQENISQPLQSLYQSITHHSSQRKDWFKGKVNSHWYSVPKIPHYDLTRWYEKKRKQVITLSHIYQKIKRRLLFV